MKAIFKYLAFLLAVLSLGCITGCKDLLTVKNEEKLSGDEFWTQGNEADVESFTLSMYAFFRSATMTASPFITSTGDFRCAPVMPFTPNNNSYFSLLASNNLNTLISRNENGESNVTDWKNFYKVVQSANILLENIGNVPGLSEQKKQEFRFEAVFMRNLSFFMMARVFGDIPYYTNAQNQSSLPRSNMVVVLNNCLNDLKSILDADPNAQNIPWLQPGQKSGIRPNRGAALLLMMHINMWLVRFDATKANTYYQNTVDLGNLLVNNNGGAYYLLDIERSSDIFRGGSAESLFEIAQNINAGETFNSASNFSNQFTYKYKSISDYPPAYFPIDFLGRLFSPEETDKRKELWFDEDIYKVDGTRKELTKFLYPDVSGGKYTSNAGNQIVFRYADGILLYAEALSELGTDESKALELLNLVRNRAGAAPKASLGTDLKDDIYWERVRELIGEGQYYFDLVRTGKIHDPNYCYHTISRANFNAGAWTWPIHPNAFLNNTKMTDNMYWK